MKLVADGGSTKTDWRLIIDEQEIHPFQSGGMNPFHLAVAEIELELSRIDLPVSEKEISEVWFYGAGISGEKAINIISTALKRRFGAQAVIHTGDDLLAAARALFKEEEGIACILGTGSNSGRCQNGHIVEKIPALGYILGDEGSGADMGKRLLNALYKRALPGEITDTIIREKNLDMHDVLQKVYRNELPARYLASYAKIIKEYVHYEPIALLAEEALQAFFERNITRYEGYTTCQAGFVGSIAYHFKDILLKIARAKGIRIEKILKNPVDELAHYHK